MESVNARGGRFSQEVTMVAVVRVTRSTGRRPLLLLTVTQARPSCSPPSCSPHGGQEEAAAPRGPRRGAPRLPIIWIFLFCCFRAYALCVFACLAAAGEGRV